MNVAARTAMTFSVYLVHLFDERYGVASRFLGMMDPEIMYSSSHSQAAVSILDFKGTGLLSSDCLDVSLSVRVNHPQIRNPNSSVSMHHCCEILDPHRNACA
jgi:hypothetical protein